VHGHAAENEQHLNPNTIGGYIDVIKQVCNKAELKGYNICNDFKSSDFYTPSNETLDTYLTIPEIHKIYNHKFDNDYLDNARDWLIISVWTGLRVSDLLTLTKKNIEDGFIKKDTLKTKFPVIIPLHNQVKAILDKRKGSFPRKISDVKYNKYIKEVCKEAEITEIIKGAKMCSKEIKLEGKKKKIHRKKFGKYPKYELISSHVGRRSFATNHYGKLDTLTLMKITGHKTEQMFLSYIKITPSEYAFKLKEYWMKIDTKEFVNS
jgi:integrase